MMAHHPLLMLQRQIDLAGRAIVAICGRDNRRCMTRSLVLLMYVVVNLGLPTGFGPQAHASSANDVCRCSPESRAAGRCCCAKGSKAGGKTGCCAARAATTKKSCCGKASTKPAAPSANSSPENSIAWTGACPCGPTDTLVILFCPHPRILPDACELQMEFVDGDRIVASTAAPCGMRTPPLVPPPEVLI